MRQKVVEYVLELCNTFAYVCLIYIMWPSRAPTYFQKLYITGSQDGSYEARVRAMVSQQQQAVRDDGGVGGGSTGYAYNSTYQDYDDGVGNMSTGHTQFDEL